MEKLQFTRTAVPLRRHSVENVRVPDQIIAPDFPDLR